MRREFYGAIDTTVLSWFLDVSKTVVFGTQINSVKNCLLILILVSKNGFKRSIITLSFKTMQI